MRTRFLNVAPTLDPIYFCEKKKKAQWGRHAPAKGGLPLRVMFTSWLRCLNDRGHDVDEVSGNNFPRRSEFSLMETRSALLMRLITGENEPFMEVVQGDGNRGTFGNGCFNSNAHRLHTWGAPVQHSQLRTHAQISRE